MVRRIRGYALFTVSNVNTLLNIIGWGGLALALAVGLCAGFLLGALFFIN